MKLQRDQSLLRLDLILFQDADLEYHPENFPDLLRPFLKDNADVVYGSRLTGAKVTKILVFRWTPVRQNMTMLDPETVLYGVNL